MNLQKKLDLRETYRTYQSAIRHQGKQFEIQILPGVVEKYYEKKNRPKR